MINDNKPMSQKRKLLLLKLESIIGECYNPYTKQQSDIPHFNSYGREFNFPITYEVNGKNFKNYKHNDDPDEKILMTGYYAFGANELRVMRNLDNLLKFIENEYNFKIDDI